MPSDEISICRACGKPIEEDAARYRTPAGDTHVHCRKEPRVLVIEGDSALRESIVGMVKRMGYMADDAANGEEAIERLPRYPYDVILCALRMPAMNGPAFGTGPDAPARPARSSSYPEPPSFQVKSVMLIR